MLQNLQVLQNSFRRNEFDTICALRIVSVTNNNGVVFIHSS